MDKINPYYNPKGLALEMLAFEDPGANYNFDTICFWATQDGRVYTAHDSGCSCPTPFEDYEGETQEDVLKLLERVGSIEQAERAFDCWNSALYNGHIPQSGRDKLSEWLKSHLTSA